MRFSYGEAFGASRGTGYEVMIYSCMIGDADAVLAHRPGRGGLAHRPADPRRLGGARRRPSSPTTRPAPGARTAAYDLIERDGRRWFEVINRETCWSGCRCSRAATRLPAQPGQHGPAAATSVAAGETIITQGRRRAARCTSSAAARSRCSTARARCSATLQRGRLLRRGRPAAVGAADGDGPGQDAAATCSCWTRPTSAASCAITRSSPRACSKVARERYNLDIGAESLLRSAPPRT